MQACPPIKFRRFRLSYEILFLSPVLTKSFRKCCIMIYLSDLWVKSEWIGLKVWVLLMMTKIWNAERDQETFWASPVDPNWPFFTRDKIDSLLNEMDASNLHQVQWEMEISQTYHTACFIEIFKLPSKLSWKQDHKESRECTDDDKSVTVKNHSIKDFSDFILFPSYWYLSDC